MKLVVAAVALVAVMGNPIPEETYQKLFTEFVQKYEKKYSMDSFFSRYNTFRSNLEFIRAHNAKEGETYTVGMNHMGDVSSEEYSQMLGYQRHNMPFLRAKNVVDLSNVTAPASIDWVAKGAVTPVKNQGQCGSCWAFSTTGSTEGANFIKNGELVSLSEQELVDCSTAEGNHACNGGLMDFGFEYIKQSGGLCSESSYPYKAKKETCNSDCGSRSAAITGYSDVAQKNEAELKKAVALGPVSVAVEADKTAFQFYKTGVLTGSACGTQLDHGVLVVGYGTEDGQDYWKVKNSWGPSWGDEGYLKVGRSDSTDTKGVCGIASQPSYPTF